MGKSKKRKHTRDREDDSREMAKRISRIEDAVANLTKVWAAKQNVVEISTNTDRESDLECDKENWENNSHVSEGSRNQENSHRDESNKRSVLGHSVTKIEGNVYESLMSLSNQQGVDIPNESPVSRIVSEAVASAAVNLKTVTQEGSLVGINSEKSLEKILDDDILQLMGEDPSAAQEDSIVLHPTLAVRWSKCLSDGVNVEVKESLLKKYPRKGAC